MAAFETGMTIIAGTGGIIGVDFNHVVEDAVHTDMDTIGGILEEMVRDKTHVMSGALASAITHLNWPATGDDSDVTFIYAKDFEQIQEWNRIYVQYQEGGLLGEGTYTNAPVEMFLQTAENEGNDAVGLWALSRISASLTALTTI